MLIFSVLPTMIPSLRYFKFYVFFYMIQIIFEVNNNTPKIISKILLLIS